MRLVNVSMWELTDQELDLAAQCEATEPEQAAELQRVKALRREHPDPPPIWSCAVGRDAPACHKGSSPNLELGETPRSLGMVRPQRYWPNGCA